MVPEEKLMYHEKFISILEQFESMWAGNYGLIKAVQPRIELTKKHGQRTHSAPYWADPKAREFKKQEVDRMLAMNVIQPAKTK